MRQAKWSSFFSSLFSHLSVLFGQKSDRYFCSGASVCGGGRRAGYTPARHHSILCFVPLFLDSTFGWRADRLTPYGAWRKNRNIGGTAYTIKRAGVVNDSAPESCADCVFGAFFGGSASHHRGFFMPVFF